MKFINELPVYRKGIFGKPLLRSTLWFVLLTLQLFLIPLLWNPVLSQTINDPVGDISVGAPDYVDLYCYAQVNGLDKLMQAVNNTVIKERHWLNPKGKKINQAYGITIYYPEEYDNDYEKLRFSEDTHWDEGLKNV